MKRQPVEVLEAVEQDLQSALDYYQSWRSDGAAYFWSRFQETVGWIEWNPELFPVKYRHYRRTIIRNTYFGIFFVIEPGITTIVAVADLRRSPLVLKSLVRTRK